MTDKKYIIGPFAGEFGYELCYWIPYVRHFVDRVNFMELDAVCLVQSGREYYRDVQCPCYSVDLDKEHDDWVYNNRDLLWDNPGSSFKDFEFVQDIVSDNLETLIEKVQLILPTEDLWSEPRRWARYDEYLPQRGRFDVIVHMRNKEDPRDVSKSDWRDIIEFFDGRSETVGIIGTSDDHIIEGVDDLRDSPPEVLCHYITQADVCLGAISGPMHLASLCGTEHIVAGNPEMPIPEVGSSLEAFERKWNPFNTRVTYTSKYRFVEVVKDFFESGGE